MGIALVSDIFEKNRGVHFGTHFGPLSSPAGVPDGPRMERLWGPNENTLGPQNGPQGGPVRVLLRGRIHRSTGTLPRDHLQPSEPEDPGGLKMLPESCPGWSPTRVDWGLWSP